MARMNGHNERVYMYCYMDERDMSREKRLYTKTGGLRTVKMEWNDENQLHEMALKS